MLQWRMTNLTSLHKTSFIVKTSLRDYSKNEKTATGQYITAASKQDFGQVSDMASQRYVPRFIWPKNAPQKWNIYCT